MFSGFIFRPIVQGMCVAGLATMLVACSSTGNAFNTTVVSQLVVGETTKDDAVRLLGADPVSTYRQGDGSQTSIWSHKSSMVTDALYFNQELWLAFGPDGRFQRVVKKHNLPVAPAPVQNTAVVTPVATVKEVAPTPPVLPADTLNINQPVVSYIINN